MAVPAVIAVALIRIEVARLLTDDLQIEIPAITSQLDSQVHPLEVVAAVATRLLVLQRQASDELNKELYLKHIYLALLLGGSVIFP